MRSRMPALTALFVCLLSAPLTGADFPVLAVDSAIREAKVFSDRALVTRTGKVLLAKGEQILVFDSLPLTIDRDSLQVSGVGKAILKDIRVEEITETNTRDGEVRVLKDRKKLLEEQIGEKQDSVNQSLKEKEYLQDIARKSTSLSDSSSNLALDVQKWTLMMEYYRTSFARIDKDLRANRKALGDLKEALEEVNRKISAMGYGNSKAMVRVSVIVDSPEEGSVPVNLSYMIQGPSWTPLYDMRFTSKDKNMEIRYNARIRQSTGEDWKDARITLSTARPEIGGNPPELSPWVLDFYTPQPYYKSSREKAGAPNMMQMMAPTTAARREYNESADALGGATAADLAARVEEAVVDQGMSSVVYTIAGKHEIKSDNQDHLVTVAVRSFPVYTRYSTVPRLSPYAYLKVNLTNKSEYSFLPGETHVFMDGNFIANGEMGFVTPGEGFWTYMGVDENIRVDYKLVNRETRKDGLLGEKEAVTWSTLVTLKNNKTTEEELVLWDQLPITRNKDITVEILDPKFNTNTDTLKKNENEYLEWLVRLKPGEEKKVPFVFTVRYPSGKQVSGLR